MNAPVHHALLVAAALLGGCAAQVTKSDGGSTPVNIPAESSRRLVLNVAAAPAAEKTGDWPAFRGAWRSAFENETSARALPFSMQDGPVKPTGEAGTLVAVTVNDYRHLSTGARYGLGVMTGNAYVDARVSYLDLRSGKSYGEQRINTSSSAWQGVFSAMTDKQLEAIARDVVNDIGPR
jgi:hypothetical protein